MSKKPAITVLTFIGSRSSGYKNSALGVTVIKIVFTSILCFIDQLYYDKHVYTLLSVYVSDQLQTNS